LERSPHSPIGPALRGLLLGLLLAGCGASERSIQSEVHYEPPAERSIVVETVVSLPFDDAWEGLIRRLSESAFQVSALEKASRFVRVDLDRSSDLAAPANQPTRYVDCGRTLRTYRDGAGEEQRFEYAVAASSRHRESDPVPEGFRVSEVERSVDLEASATIFLQPEGRDRTRVVVKSRYRVVFEIGGQASIHPRDADEPIAAAQAFGPRVESIRFTTFQPGTDRRQGGLSCRATGEFEHALVALANPAAAI
jgi:hypothetical protein